MLTSTTNASLSTIGTLFVGSRILFVVPLSSWLVWALCHVHLLIQRRALLTLRYLPGLSGGWICRFVPFYICPSGRTCMLPGLWSVSQIGHLCMMQWSVVPCLFLLPLWQCPLLSFGLSWHGWLGLWSGICGCPHRLLWCWFNFVPGFNFSYTFPASSY